MSARPRTFDRYVEVGPTRDRIQALLAAGTSIRSIAAATGLTASGVWGVQRPGQVHVQKRTADLIAAVTLTDCVKASAGLVPAEGARRRIRALMTLGWRHADQQAVMGVATHVILTKRGDKIEAPTYRAIVAGYDRLWDQRGPSRRTQLLALRKGWAPPLAWDDDSIDDPSAQPWTNPATDITAPGRGVVNADSLADCATWGMTLVEAAHRLGMTRAAIEHGIARHAPHLRERFARNAVAKGVAA